jgi:hypothetical protein
MEMKLFDRDSLVDAQLSEFVWECKFFLEVGLSQVVMVHLFLEWEYGRSQSRS